MGDVNRPVRSARVMDEPSIEDVRRYVMELRERLVVPQNIIVSNEQLLRWIDADTPDEMFHREPKRLQQPEPVRVSAPPGHTLLAIAEFLCSERTFDEILRPTIDDMRREYNQALADDRRAKAKWVRMRGTWSFLAAAGMVAFGSVGKLVVRVWRLIG